MTNQIEASTTIRPAGNANEYRDQLISEHFELVGAVARNIRRSIAVHIELDDLVHAGVMGLIDAATKYDASKEVPFPVYAKLRIRGSILDSLRNLDWASREARKTYRQMDAVAQQLAATLQRTPTGAEIAEAMGLDENRWRTLMMDYGTVGLATARQSQVSDEEGKSARECSSPESESPDQLYAKAEIKAQLGQVLGTLPKRYQQVVQLYYENEMSMREIGVIMGVNESRVSQIHKAALAKMQASFSCAGLSASMVA